MGLTPPHLRGQIFLSILGVVIRIGLVCFNSLFLSLDHWRSTQAGVRDRERSLSLSFPACLLTPRITGRLVTIKSFGRSSQAGVRDRERNLSLSFFLPVYLPLGPMADQWHNPIWNYSQYIGYFTPNRILTFTFS